MSFYLSFLHVTRNANTIIDTIWSSICDVSKTDIVCISKRIISIPTCCILWHTISIRGSTLRSIQIFSLAFFVFQLKFLSCAGKKRKLVLSFLHVKINAAYHIKLNRKKIKHKRFIGLTTVI